MSIRKEIDESFLPIITVLLGIGFVVGAAVVGLTIYTATIERSMKTELSSSKTRRTPRT
jgi:hypothetical protein